MRNKSKQKSQEIKQLHSTFRSDKVAKSTETEKKLQKLPDPPENLNGMGLAYYNNEGSEFLELGLLNQFNLPLFLDICFYISEKEKLSVKIDRARNISDYARYRKLYDDANQRQRLCMQELGLLNIKYKEHGKKTKLEEWLEEWN